MIDALVAPCGQRADIRSRRRTPRREPTDLLVDYELHALVFPFRVCHMGSVRVPTIYEKGDRKMGQAEVTDALTSIVKVLTPLTSDERRRTVDAAMMFLGEGGPTPSPKGRTNEDDGGHAGAAGTSSTAKSWMKQNDVTQDELDHVFNFSGDGTFEIIDAPGKSKKEKSLNTYVLTGLGWFLATGERTFDDATARSTCEKIGCYDAANHASYLKDRGNEFTGDKTKGYSMTNPGIKRGAALVKEVASGAK
jgi:hypothetical protein